MRRAAKTDGNHQDVLDALRKIGCSAKSLHSVGQGCPDILAGYRGLNILLEVKDGSRFPSEQRLTADERDWHAGWSGQVCVVKSVEEAVIAVVDYAKKWGAL